MNNHTIAFPQGLSGNAPVFLDNETFTKHQEAQHAATFTVGMITLGILGVGALICGATFIKDRCFSSTPGFDASRLPEGTVATHVVVTEWMDQVVNLAGNINEVGGESLA
jgi:hypothetical protein